MQCIGLLHNGNDCASLAIAGLLELQPSASDSHCHIMASRHGATVCVTSDDVCLSLTHTAVLSKRRHGRWNRGSSCSPNFWHERAGHSSCSPKSLSLLHWDCLNNWRAGTAKNSNLLSNSRVGKEWNGLGSLIHPDTLDQLEDGYKSKQQQTWLRQKCAFEDVYTRKK